MSRDAQMTIGTITLDVEIYSRTDIGQYVAYQISNGYIAFDTQLESGIRNLRNFLQRVDSLLCDAMVWDRYGFPDYCFYKDKDDFFFAEIKKETDGIRVGQLLHPLVSGMRGGKTRFVWLIESDPIGRYGNALNLGEIKKDEEDKT